MRNAPAPGGAHPVVTVVVPTYNERENLPRIVGELFALDVRPLNIVVVDDSSPDGTGDVADELAGRAGRRLDVLHRTTKDGLGRAYVAGMLLALEDGADIVIQMDADLSHPVAAIPRMIDVLATTDAGVVIGSRYVPGGTLDTEWPWHRRALSRWANRYVAGVLRLDVKDATAGFKAWRAETLRSIDLDGMTSNGYSFQTEATYRARRCGIDVSEVPIHFAERTSGTSKMSLGVQLEAVVMPWHLRRSRWLPVTDPASGAAAVSGRQAAVERRA